MESTEYDEEIRILQERLYGTDEGLPSWADLDNDYGPIPGMPPAMLSDWGISYEPNGHLAVPRKISGKLHCSDVVEWMRRAGEAYNAGCRIPLQLSDRSRVFIDPSTARYSLELGYDGAALSLSAYLTETPDFCKSIRGGRHEQGAV